MPEYVEFYTASDDVTARLRALVVAHQFPVPTTAIDLEVNRTKVWRLRWRWPLLCRVWRYRLCLSVVPCEPEPVSSTRRISYPLTIDHPN